MTGGDVLVVGAGPAGTVAAICLARAGARVRMLDRAVFPRDKLCGDTVNPGTLALLRRLQLAASIEARGMSIRGMLVSAGNGVAVEGLYPAGRQGVAISRRDLDGQLLQQALAAGVAFETGVPVREAIVEGPSDAPRVTGVRIAANGSVRSLTAPVVIAADGRRSALAFGLRLTRHPARPKRWAIGAYFEDHERSTVGEMHIRDGWYLGVAPLGGGVSNVCLVTPCDGPAARGETDVCDFRDPPGLLRRAIAREPRLRDRFAGRAEVRAPIMLGPLAVDHVRGEVEGLILAGDAAGFIDPMTGDGLRFAVRGGEMAAAAALSALQHGWQGVHHRLSQARRREFAAKWRFNRALRSLVDTPAAMRAAAAGARVAPGLVNRLIGYAADLDIA
jgi:flavin-dependent dehydrogenase